MKTGKIIMTDLEFATCDLEHIDEILAIQNTPRKFYERRYDDSVYAIVISLEKHDHTFLKYEFHVKDMEPARTTGSSKARLYNIYFDDPTPGRKRRGIQVDKNRSSIIKSKKIQKKSVYLIIYGTTLDECVKRAENMLCIPVEDKLKWMTTYWD